MIILLCGLVALAAIGALMIHASDDRMYTLLGMVTGTFGFICMFAAAAGLIAYCALVFDYMSSEHKARIMNREYGTHYTQEEVFYASSVIDTVRELDRKRFEVNGDILKAK